MVANYAKKEISIVVICEMVYGKTHGNLVYVMYPYEPNPFFEHYSHRIFKTEDQFLTFLQWIASKSFKEWPLNEYIHTGDYLWDF